MAPKANKTARKVNDTTASMQAASIAAAGPAKRQSLASTWKRVNDKVVGLGFAWKPDKGGQASMWEGELDFSGVDPATLQYWACTNGIVVKIQSLLRRGERVGPKVIVADIMPGEGERRQGSGGGFVRKDFVAIAQAQIAQFKTYGVPVPKEAEQQMLRDARKQQAEYDARREAQKASAPSADVVPMPTKSTAAKAAPRKK